MDEGSEKRMTIMLRKNEGNQEKDGENMKRMKEPRRERKDKKRKREN